MRSRICTTFVFRASGIDYTEDTLMVAGEILRRRGEMYEGYQAAISSGKDRHTFRYRDGNSRL